MQAQPYLMFEGRTEEALAFYKSALGAEIEAVMRYGDTPETSEHAPPGSKGKVMHSAFKIGDSMLMASDGQCSGKTNFQGISLALTVRNDSEAEQKFSALADGGQIQMPLTKAFFASSFGLVADRFGVNWMVVTAQ